MKQVFDIVVERAAVAAGDEIRGEVIACRHLGTGIANVVLWAGFVDLGVIASQARSDVPFASLEQGQRLPFRLSVPMHGVPSFTTGRLEHRWQLCGTLAGRLIDMPTPARIHVRAPAPSVALEARLDPRALHRLDKAFGGLSKRRRLERNRGRGHLLADLRAGVERLTTRDQHSAEIATIEAPTVLTIGSDVPIDVLGPVDGEVLGLRCHRLFVVGGSDGGEQRVELVYERWVDAEAVRRGVDGLAVPPRLPPSISIGRWGVLWELMVCRGTIASPDIANGTSHHLIVLA